MWFKVDDNFLNHDKLLEFDGDPVRWSRNISVWLACGLCCSQNQSDGLLRASRVRRLCAPGVDVDSALDDLRAVGLVDVIDGDDWVHDFLEYNPSREQQDEKKRKHAETQKKYRDNARKREKSRKAARDISRNNHSDITQPVTQPRGDNGRDTPPNRTDPIRTVPIRTEDTPAPIGTDTEEDSMWSDKLKKELRRTGRNQAELRQQLLAPPSRATVRDWCSGKTRPTDDEQADIDRVMALFAKQHAAKLEAGKSEAQRYQDDVCLGFASMWSEKFGAKPMWKPGRDFAAIKRWREADVSTQVVLERAAVMLVRSGSAWPCEHGCDFGTLIQHFDRFVEAKPPVEAPRPMTRAAKARKAAAEANR